MAVCFSDLCYSSLRGCELNQLIPNNLTENNRQLSVDLQALSHHGLPILHNDAAQYFGERDRC